MEIKFFNLNIKHKYHSFNPELSAAEYWLSKRNAAPIFYGKDTCEAILSGRSSIEKKYEKIVNKFLEITSFTDIKPIFVTIDSGFLWIYEPIGKPIDGEMFSFINKSKAVKNTHGSYEEYDLPKFYKIKHLIDKLPISEVPYILAAMKSSQAFAQGTFYPIGENIDGDPTNKYNGNLAALKVLLKDVDFVRQQFNELLIDPLHCLSSIELETLLAKIFEVNECFVPAHRGGVLKDVDLFVDTPKDTRISGIASEGNVRLSIQIKLNIPKNKNEIQELAKFLNSSKNHYLITSEDQYEIGLEAFKNTGQYLTAGWIRGQIAENKSVQKWFDSSVDWLPKENRIL
jgi:hypothetical protein